MRIAVFCKYNVISFGGMENFPEQPKETKKVANFSAWNETFLIRL
jgi:hypothetical protein